MSGNSLTSTAFAYHQEGRHKEAEAFYRRAIDIDPDDFQALQLLGTLALREKRHQEALDLFERTLSILECRSEESAGHAVLYNNLGITLHALGRCVEAIESLRRGLKLNPNLVELYISLGRTLMKQGDYVAAIDCYRTALGLNPDLAECHYDLGDAYVICGQLDDAIVAYRSVLSLDDTHENARVNLARLLRRTRHYDEAINLLTDVLRKTPNNLLAHSQLGRTYLALKRFDLALDHFARILILSPDDADALRDLADTQKLSGNMQDAGKNYLRSHALKPLATIPAIKSAPDFRALLLFSPYAGNTPVDCMVDRVEYENNILHLLPDAVYDIDMLRDKTDVVINLIADVDQSQAMLEPAAKLVDQIGRPIVNHPRNIMPTDRESVARLLTDIPDCFVPQTRRYAAVDAGAVLCDPDFDITETGLSFPVLARPAGTHGGEDFEKIRDNIELKAFIWRHVGHNYYLTNYVDYRSADGFFRKYRFIFVNDEILPYHLAIDDKWKVHHATTDMAKYAWMQQEEASFLENPHAIFNSQKYEALDLIRKKIGLDYFGIDCALDREGRVVVFEVNACMLVHHRNEQFPYKNAAVDRIKAALYTMLKRMASSEKQNENDLYAIMPVTACITG